MPLPLKKNNNNNNFTLQLHFRCHPWTGGCMCKPGYAGYHCHRPCPVYTFGRNCAQVCDCQNDAFCDPSDGICTCAPGFLGPK